MHPNSSYSLSLYYSLSCILLAHQLLLSLSSALSTVSLLISITHIPSHPLYQLLLSSRYPARARFDRARDRYITAKGYDILRLQLIGRSIDDLVSQIKDKVDEKTEQFADRQIQQIYAVDASSLYTPEAARKVYSPRKNIKTD